MIGERLSPAGDTSAPPPLSSGGDDLDRVGAAGAAKLVEPGVTGEIVSAGHSHGRGRHQPGPDADRGARLKGRPGVLGVDVEAEPGRQAGLLGADDATNGLPCGDALDGLDFRREPGQGGTFTYRRGA